MKRFQWVTKHVVETVTITLSDAEANALYNDIYRLFRDRVDPPADFPEVVALYDTLADAGVDGTR